jgi:hypothetical protein
MNLNQLRSNKKVLIAAMIIMVAALLLVVAYNSMKVRSSTGIGYFNNRYSLTYPDTWKKEQPSTDSVKFTLDASSVAFVEITTLDAFQGDVSVEAYTNDFVANSETKLTDFKVVTLEAAQLLGLDATNLEFKFKDQPGGTVFKSAQVDLLYGNKVYRITYTTEAILYDAYYPAYANLLATFKVY